MSCISNKYRVLILKLVSMLHLQLASLIMMILACRLGFYFGAQPPVWILPISDSTQEYLCWTLLNALLVSLQSCVLHGRMSGKVSVLAVLPGSCCQCHCKHTGSPSSPGHLYLAMKTYCREWGSDRTRSAVAWCVQGPGFYPRYHKKKRI